jgi:hypothetical protein
LRGIIVVVKIRAVKIYVAVVEVFREKEKGVKLIKQSKLMVF